MTSKYGEIGTKYEIGGGEIFVDEKFIISTLMALIYVVSQSDKDQAEKIEYLAGKLYDEIKEVKSDDTERTTDTPA
jgi:hypothetical protein